MLGPVSQRHLKHLFSKPLNWKGLGPPSRGDQIHPLAYGSAACVHIYIDVCLYQPKKKKSSDRYYPTTLQHDN